MEKNGAQTMEEIAIMASSNKNNAKNLLIKDVKLLDKGGKWDITISNGIIATIKSTPAVGVSSTNNNSDGNDSLGKYKIINATNMIALPGLVDGHVHLDKCYLLDRCCATKGDLPEALTSTLNAKKSFSTSDVYDRARRLIENEISFGTSIMRTHVEVDPFVGFESLDAILLLKKEYEELITIQIAVFAQEGITNQPGQVDLMRKALQMGK